MSYLIDKWHFQLLDNLPWVPILKFDSCKCSWSSLKLGTWCIIALDLRSLPSWIFIPIIQEEAEEEPKNGRYTLKSVKKIDHYSRLYLPTHLHCIFYLSGEFFRQPTSPLLYISSSVTMQSKERSLSTSWSNLQQKKVKIYKKYIMKPFEEEMFNPCDSFNSRAYDHIK